jgi:ketosteroid isomerase-like protein
MTTKELIERYFSAIHDGSWEAYIADEFIFVNNNLDNVSHGKPAYVQGAGRFFRMTTGVDVKRMVVEGDTAAVIARYALRSPKGASGVCDVAELLTVGSGKLTSSAIFFDAKALAEFMTQG